MDNRYRSVRMADDKRKQSAGIAEGASSLVKALLGLVVALAAVVILLAFTKPYLVAEARDALLGLLR